MWQDYEETYREALQDPEFLAWRELGAQRKADNIMRVCRGLNPGSVIEIGCGTGAVLRRLHAANFARHYFCTDLSPSAIDYVRASCPAFAANAAVGQAEALAFPDGAFDLAILSHVIEHMEDPLGALREASRVARFVVVEVPTEKVAVNIVRTKILRQPYPSVAGAGHVQFWSPGSIAAFLEEEAGLEILVHHQDLLNDEGGCTHPHGGGARKALKHSLRACLPAPVYARLFTTHAAFCARGRAAPRKLNRPRGAFPWRQGPEGSRVFSCGRAKKRTKERLESNETTTMINFSALRPESLPGRIARFPFRLIPPDLAVPVLQGPLRGKRWIVGSHLHGCWLGSYEWEMQKRIAGQIEPGSVFYDVGANVGFYSLLGALRVGTDGRVYAFEPLPENAAFLRRHLAMNRIRNVEIFETAISDQSGTAWFSSESTRAMGKLAAAGTVTVATATLDELIAEGRIAPPNTIKMDIEGAEFAALNGARKCFERYRPKLFLATHGRGVHNQCCQLLSSWNYEWTYLSRESEERSELFAQFPAQ